MQRGERRAGGGEDGLDTLLCVLCSGNVLLIVSLDPSPDSSLPGLEKQSTPDTSTKRWEEKRAWMRASIRPSGQDWRGKRP